MSVPVDVQLDNLKIGRYHNALQRRKGFLTAPLYELCNFPTWRTTAEYIDFADK